MEAEPVSLISIAHFFPRTPPNEIVRDNLLDLMEETLNENNLIVIEGYQGVGKTTLMSQFARRNSSRTLSIFVSSGDALSADLGVIRTDLGSQINFALGRFEPVEDVNQGTLNQLLFQMSRLARKKHGPYYLVVDGIDDVPKIADALLSSLPIGSSAFKLLVAVQKRATLPRLERAPPIAIPGFTVDESDRFLSDVVLDNNVRRDVHKLLRGVPERLASFKRLVATGSDPETLLREPASANELFEKEWAGAGELTGDERLLVALLAHDNQRQTVASAADLTNLEVREVERLVNRLSFLEIDAENQTLTFVAEPIRSFVRGKLADLATTVNDLLISKLLEHPDADETLRRLPGYLEQAGRLEQLLRYLTPERFEQLLAKTETLAFLKDRVAAASRAATALGDDYELVRTTIQRCVILDIDRGSRTARHEVVARVAVADYEGALRIAQTAVLKEDRLQLLAVIANGKRESGLTPEPEIVETIRVLAEEVDGAGLGARAVSLAEDLVHILPDAAARLLQAAREGGSMPGRSFDLALTHMTVQASLAREGSDKSLDVVRGLISDHQLRRFSSHVHTMATAYSADEMLDAFSDLDRAEDQLFFMKHWLRHRKDAKGAHLVVKAALDMLIRTTDYVPTATDFRELATPLQYLQDDDAISVFLQRFDAQATAIENVGPTIDYVRLRLLLALATRRISMSQAQDRFLEAYYYSTTIAGASERAAALAWILKTLPQVDPTGEFESHEGVGAVIETDLRTLITEILNGTANHEVAVRPVILALAKTRLDLAQEIAKSLNTEPRRDQALLEIIESAIDRRSDDVQLAQLIQMLGTFASLDLRDAAILLLIERVARDPHEFAGRRRDAMSLFGRVGEIRDGVARTKAFALASLFASAEPDLASFRATCVERVEETIGQLDDVLRKLDAAYTAIPILRRSDLEDARRILRLVEEIRDSAPLYDEHTSEVMSLSIRLAVRALGGALVARIDVGSDTARIISLIGVVPSVQERIDLLTSLVLRYIAARRTDEARTMTATYIRPLLGSGVKNDVSSRIAAVVTALPALFALNKTIGLDYLESLDPLARDEALRELARYAVSKLPFEDPFDGDSVSNVDFDTARELLDIASRMDHDIDVYTCIRTVCTAVRGDRVSGQQKQELLQIVQRLIATKFPNPRYITHQGYARLAEAQLFRSRNAKAQEWRELVDASRSIPNIADRSFVLAGIAGVLPPRESELRDDVARESLAVAEDIPSILDRAEHHYWLASELAEIMPSLAKKALQQCAKAVVGPESEKIRLRRRVVDLAHSMDPSFATSVAAIMDSDGARVARLDVKRQMAALKMKSQLVDSHLRLEDEPENNDAFPRTAWLLLRSLNAGTIASERLDNMRRLISIAGESTLTHSYPVLALAIQSVVRKYAETDQAVKTIRPVLDSALSAAEFAGRFAQVLAHRQTAATRSTPVTENQIVIRPGERERGLRWISDWIAKSVRTYLKIADPFFGPADLELVKLVGEIHPECLLKVLTGRKQQVEEVGRLGSTSVEDAYRSSWSLLSEQAPPSTEILVVGIEPSGEAPIHDRWWLTESGGLRVGTSFNGIGKSKVSEISVLSAFEAQQLEQELDRYWSRQPQEAGARRLQFTQFNL